jgi:hypothetical protein
MKRLFLILVSLGMLFSAFAADEALSMEEFKEELADKLSLLSIDDDDWENEYTEEEFFVLKVDTSQDERDTDLRPVLRVTFKLFDKKTKTTVFVQAEKTAGRIPGNDRYAGRTEWEFHVPFDGMKKPKLIASAVEFGVKKDGEFIIAEAEYDDVENADEIMKGDGIEVSATKSTCKHQTTESDN